VGSCTTPSSSLSPKGERGVEKRQLFRFERREPKPLHLPNSPLPLGGEAG